VTKERSDEDRLDPIGVTGTTMAIEHSISVDDPPAAAPTATEAALLDIWQRMLWLDDIGLHDSFIDLGGNSLSATRCINRIRTTFGVEVPMEAFFLDAADIATIAHLIDDAREDTGC
jgi:acyl carrier protein